MSHAIESVTQNLRNIYIVLSNISRDAAFLYQGVANCGLNEKSLQYDTIQKWQLTDILLLEEILKNATERMITFHCFFFLT